MSALPTTSGIGRIAGGLGNIGSRVLTGLGGVVAPNGGAQGQVVDPQLAAALRQQALLTLGLGMMAGSARGGSFGESALQGLGLATGSYQDAMNTAYRNAMVKREDERRDKEFNRQGEVIKREDQWRMFNATEERKYQEAQAKRDAEAAAESKRRWEAGYQLDVNADRRADAGQMSGPQMGTIPAGYMLDPSNPTQLVRMPGGPADNKPALSSKDATVARQKLLMIDAARKQLAQAKDKFAGIEGGLTAGPLQGYIPSQGGREFDAAIDQSRNLISGIFRVPGVGAMSDYETRLQQAAFPDRADYESVTSQKLQTLDDQLAALETGYRDMLGEQAGMGGPTTDQPPYSGPRVEKRGNVTIEWSD